MRDPRMTALADVLLRHSVKLAPGEKILIEATDVPTEMVTLLVERAHEIGAQPFTWLKTPAVNRALIKGASEEQMRVQGQWELNLMEQMQAYIGLRGSMNSLEMSDVPDERMKLYREHVWKVVHTGQRVSHTRWVVLRWPTPSMAQQAGMSTSAFEDFYFDVCAGVDYAQMRAAAEPLLQRMERTDKVRILGPGDTDIMFSIKGIPAIPCCGDRNIPDGECYTAPVRDSVNGIIHFNTPTTYNDVPYEDIRLVFLDGKIVEATGSDTDALNKVLDSDEGSRYIGEFALGFNPYINRPMRDILFDEKIAGSLHFTPGNAYEIADNGNRSQIHWDMVLIQTPEKGGGDIFFDGELVRHDGLFVPEELHGLNPENLIKR
ncbi:MAG TPA: aminopeptidase [Armatimonadota bacterium]|nr:aminopeptidase [Armatimonadota bacterium]